ncbi:FtsX-like permease family protein [Acidobacteria bacterium ACD]|nr:MAG: FtsX-like permease family protein [Acidobacteriota bacterium]MCE7960057.1 ABC transporter permease [Acidobacteria bacterium ACB2]MDL1951983.1 FtsX-like permease family protein [Acidobacteria bacterium ACD]
MTFGDVLGFALRALRGHRLRSGLSLLGVAVGVGSVVLLTSLGEGARLFVTAEFRSLGSNLLILLPGKAETSGGVPTAGGTTHDLTLDDLDAVARSVPSVARIAPLVFATVEAEAGPRKRDAIVAGTTWELKAVRGIPLVAGTYLPSWKGGNPPRVCVLGHLSARELFGGTAALGQFVRVGGERYRVVGVTGPRGVTVGLRLDDMIHVPAPHVLRMLDRRGVFRALVEVRSAGEVDAARRGVIRVLSDRHGEEDVTVFTQDSLVAGLSSILGILTAALGAIAAISLAVAGIGIMNVMLVSVTERTREIGLLKAVGVTSGQVRRVFLFESALLSSTGGLLGLLLGGAAVVVFRAVWPSFPAQPPAWAVVAASSVALLVGVLFGLLPASRAARLDPIDALSRGGA